MQMCCFPSTTLTSTPLLPTSPHKGHTEHWCWVLNTSVKQTPQNTKGILSTGELNQAHLKQFIPFYFLCALCLCDCGLTLFESLWLTVGHCQSNPSQLYLWEHVYGLRLGLTWLNAAESQATSLPLICGGSDCTVKTLKDHTVIFGEVSLPRSFSLLSFRQCSHALIHRLVKSSPPGSARFLFLFWFVCFTLLPFFVCVCALLCDVAAENLSHAANAMSQCLSALNRLG